MVVTLESLLNDETELTMEDTNFLNSTPPQRSNDYGN